MHIVGDQLLLTKGKFFLHLRTMVHLKLGYDLINQFQMGMTSVASVRKIMVSFVLVIFNPTSPRSQWIFPRSLSRSLENMLTICSLTSSSTAEFLRLDNSSDDIDKLAINELFEVLYFIIFLTFVMKLGHCESDHSPLTSDVGHYKFYRSFVKRVEAVH